jgi:hypothetical protein
LSLPVEREPLLGADLNCSEAVLCSNINGFYISGHS